MSFDLFFQTARFFEDEKAVLQQEPLTQGEAQAVKAILRRADPLGPDAYWCYLLQMEDGGRAELFARDPAWGCMVSAGAITPALSRFLFDLLVAGNWVMVPAVKECLAITASPSHVKSIPEDFPPLIVCKSGTELAVLLADGLEAWRAFRDRAARR